MPSDDLKSDIKNGIFSYVKHYKNITENVERECTIAKCIHYLTYRVVHKSFYTADELPFQLFSSCTYGASFCTLLQQTEQKVQTSQFYKTKDEGMCSRSQRSTQSLQKCSLFACIHLVQRSFHGFRRF